MENRTIIEIQYALFFENNIIDPDVFATRIREEENNIFDQVPIILPIPNQQEFYEVPVVQMSSSDGVFFCKIARSRIDFIIKTTRRAEFADLKEQLLQNIVKISRLIFISNRIKRLAIITRYFVGQENGFEIIARSIDDRFKRIMNNSEVANAVVQYAVKRSWRDLEVFDNTSLHTTLASVVNYITNEKGILITRDFNTNKEIDYSNRLSEEFIRGFITYTEDNLLFDEIIEYLWNQNQNQSQSHPTR